MNIDDIRSILIVGCGTMGRLIGLQCARCGYDTVFYDISASILQSAQDEIREHSESFISRGLSTKTEMNKALDRIKMTTDPAEAGKDADLVSESAPEIIDIKKEIFSQFNRICPPSTIFTTNTSSLLPSMLADATGRSSQFAALHFHHPWRAKIVDIMPHPGTSAETIELLSSFAKRIRQIPVVLKKENPGFVFNEMYSNLLSVALGLKMRDIASVEDIDRLWMVVMGMPKGPFGMMDFNGLDTVYNVIHFWAKQTGDKDKLAQANFLKNEYLEKGKLGIKSGEGFYSYPNPAYSKQDFLSLSEPEHTLSSD